MIKNRDWKIFKTYAADLNVHTTQKTQVRVTLVKRGYMKIGIFSRPN